MEHGLNQGTGFATNDIFGVDGIAVVTDFEMEMAAAGATGVAAKTYLLACTDTGARCYMAFGKVGIIGLKSVVVADNNEVAIRAVVFREANHAVESSIDGFARRHGEVETIMETATARAEMRGGTGILRRWEDEKLAMLGIGKF